MMKVSYRASYAATPNKGDGVRMKMRNNSQAIDFHDAEARLLEQQDFLADRMKAMVARLEKSN
jgi:hypothetical protein